VEDDGAKRAVAGPERLERSLARLVRRLAGNGEALIPP
jgi:hypothetical protein